MQRESQTFLKKKPEAALSKKKVKLTNRLLEKALVVLDSEPEREFLDLLDEDDVPENSDVVLMLSQYATALSSFFDRYEGWRPGGWRVAK